MNTAGTDIVIHGDQSISRKHATLQVLEEEGKVIPVLNNLTLLASFPVPIQNRSGHQTIVHSTMSLPMQVVLTDCKSKFGTCVNESKLQPNEKVDLHHNDVIKFGQGPKNSKFR